MELAQLVTPTTVLGVFLSILAGIFLFWRGSRHELYSNEQIFDFLGIGLLGGLVGGRLLVFFLNPGTFHFSFPRLVFFHIFPGFNFYGFILGLMLATAVFLRGKRVSVWSFFDFAAGPILFGFFVNSAFHAMAAGLSGKQNPVFMASAVFYLLSFAVLKRFATLTRHKGFFSCYLLIVLPVWDIFKFLLANWNKLNGALYLEIAVPIGVFLFGILAWYALSKRKLKADLKKISSSLFLKVLAFFRIIRSADEAGKIAKGLILIPFFISKGILVSLRKLFREIRLGFWEFIYVLGFRR